jgi:hypothetical protein
MRLPNAAHESFPWRIRNIVPDFTLEDVWALPVEGGAGDFRSLVELIASLDPAAGDSLAARALWKLRDLLGRWLDIGRTAASSDSGGADAGEKLPIPGTTETSLAGRLPDDLRGTVTDREPGSLPFSPLFRTDREYAAEISNKTVFGVLHLAWADQGNGRFQGQMAVYVKPRGRFGSAYMNLIRPFRHWIVYPALMRGVQRSWNARRREGFEIPDRNPGI